MRHERQHMALLIFRPDLQRWVNQEVGGAQQLDPSSLLLVNVLIELRLLTQLLEMQNSKLVGDTVQNMREEIAFNVPLNAF